MNNQFKFLLQFISVSCGTIMFSLPVAHAAKSTLPLDRIIAIVNDTVVTQSEFDHALQTAQNQIMSTHTPPPQNTILHKQVLDQLINRKLELQLAEQSGIHVTEEELTKVITGIASNNQISIDELYKKITSEGLSKEEYRKEIRDELIIQHIQQQEVGSKVTLNHEEVDTFMRTKAWRTASDNSDTKEYHVEDILLSVPEMVSPKSLNVLQKRAEALTSQLRHNLDVKALATQQDVANNDLGWRKLSEMPSAFASHLSGMKKNEVAGPIQTANGFHVLILTEVRNSAAPAAETQMPSAKQAEQMLYQHKMALALQSWVAKLRAEAFVNLHPDS